jgi:hypothetical protein
VDLFASEVAEDDEDKHSKKPKKSQTLMTQQDDVLTRPKDPKQAALVQSISKIKKNLELAEEALTKHQNHAHELQESIKTSHGVAKRELKKLLKTSEEHVDYLEKHVAEGKKVLEQKNSLLKKQQAQTQVSVQKQASKPVNSTTPSAPKTFDENLVKQQVSEKTAELEKKYEQKVSSLESKLKQMESKMLTQLDSKQKDQEKEDKKLQEQQKAQLEEVTHKYDDLLQTH